MMLFLLLLFSFFLCIENSTFIEPFHAGHSCFAFVFECKSHPSFLRFPSLTHQRFQRKFDLKAPGVRVSSRYELPGSQAQKVQAITANGARMWRRALRMSAELSPEEQTERAQSTAVDPTAPSAAPPGTRRRNRKPKPPPADPFAPPPGPESFPPYAPRDFFRYELIHQSSRSNARARAQRGQFPASVSRFPPQHLDPLCLCSLSRTRGSSACRSRPPPLPSPARSLPLPPAHASMLLPLIHPPTHPPPKPA